MPVSVLSNNMRRSFKILIGFLLLLTLIVALLAKMPAQFALSLASEKTAAFSFNSAQGTLWQGQVHGLLVNTGRQSMPVGKVQWQLSPWSLFGLNLALRFSSTHPLWSSEGEVQASISKQLHAKNLHLTMPAALLTKIYPVPAKVSGMADVTIQELGLDGNALKVTALTGQLLLKDIDVTIQSQAALGSYGVRLNLEGEAIVATISDVDAPLSVDGSARFDQGDRSYQATVTVVPGATASNVIQQSLNFIAKKQSDGSFLLSYEGRL